MHYENFQKMLSAKMSNYCLSIAQIIFMYVCYWTLYRLPLAFLLHTQSASHFPTDLSQKKNTQIVYSTNNHAAIKMQRKYLPRQLLYVACIKEQINKCCMQQLCQQSAAQRSAKRWNISVLKFDSIRIDIIG